MVNKDPDEVDDELLPETTEPVARDNYDNLMVGVYRTVEDGVWVLEVYDWANRVVEATVYDTGLDEPREEGAVSFQQLKTPDEMDHEAYLQELLANRVDALTEEEKAEA